MKMVAKQKRGFIHLLLSGLLQSKYGVNLGIALLKKRPNFSMDGALQPQEALEYAAISAPQHKKSLMSLEVCKISWGTDTQSYPQMHMTTCQISSKLTPGGDKENNEAIRRLHRLFKWAAVMPWL